MLSNVRAVSRISALGLRNATTRSFIPPSLATKQGASGAAAANTEGLGDLVHIYRQLPKGPAPAQQSSGPLDWYRRRYFEGPNASPAPILHIMIALGLLGYYIEYTGHLSHHKNVKHH